MQLTPQTILYLFYAMAAATAIIVAELLYVQFVSTRNKSAINRRLRRLAGDQPPESALKSLLKERGLTETGDYRLGLVWLNRLYAQSGFTGRPLSFALVFVLIGTAIAIGFRVMGASLPVSFLVGLVLTLSLPLWYLRRARIRRLGKFERQLPDALDMIVRSLRAGHPTSVAIGLVARELPDPVGTEFGIALDEVTFGATLETAVRKMAERVGFEGLQLLSVAMSIQSRTGGNLAEILQNLSKTLRSRHVLRLKVRSLAAEGKLSAVLMSAFPLVMFGVLALISPSYYGQVWNDPMTIPLLTGFGIWALLGDFIMYRMVNFDF